ncbi:protein-disulfide reductase DsbD family protein [Ferruginibacter sp.]
MKFKRLLFTSLLLLGCISLFAQTKPGVVNELAGKSLWGIFLKGLGVGFLAALQPCIYAMIPVTVSFFLKRSTSRAKGLKNALFYSLSIISIFTVIGVGITLIFGDNALYEASSSAGFNIFVFLLFLIFGISFLGAFEINLPASWANKVDSKAGTGNYSGIFFMALTLVIVSFSCTVPFISGLTKLISQEKQRLAPALGFMGFSLALALPFAFFALFPGLLNKIAKSGGWLNTMKVSFGFLELALSLKFLSNADLAYHWRILDREVYLSLWIVIFGLLGFYLLGKLKFSHDDDLPKNDYGHPYLTVTRTFFAIAALMFTVYMIPGLWGAPLKGISAWIPETKTQDFNLNKIAVQNANDTTTTNSTAITTASQVKPKKYTDFLESEILGVDAFFDYDEALDAAKKLNRPVMIDFTGHSCANCRKMESEVLNQDEIRNDLKNNFVLASLYVDDKYNLPESEQYTSKNDGSLIKRMGAKNLDFEATIANSNAQPLYIFVDKDGKVILNAGGYEPGIDRFKKILEDVKTEFKKRYP